MFPTIRLLGVLVWVVGCTGSPLSTTAVSADASLALDFASAEGPPADEGTTSDRPMNAGGGALGAPCSTAAQCRSNLCVDGVCCADACTGLCAACNVAGAAGVCTPIPAGQHPGTECEAQPASTCGLDGACDGHGNCRQHPSGTTCAAPTCAAEMATAAGTCDGIGHCQGGASHTCGGYLCDGNVCGAKCATASECDGDFTCTVGACVLVKVGGLIVFDPEHADGWSVQTNFQVGVTGAHPWSDHPATYVAAVDATLAKVLLGHEWIQVSDASRAYDGGPQATLSLASASDVYLVVDDRWPDHAWTAGWADTGAKMQIWESAALPAVSFSIYVKKAQSDSVDLPGIAGAAAYDSFAIVD